MIIPSGCWLSSHATDLDLHHADRIAFRDAWRSKRKSVMIESWHFECLGNTPERVVENNLAQTL